jgi:anti-sigma factor RsiW
MTLHPTELLGAYADGELPPEAAARVEAHLEACTECGRELALIRTLGGAMREMETTGRTPSAWERVHGRITRPVGWTLLLAGAAVWAGIAIAAWFRQSLTLEWLAGTAVAVGVLMLLVGIGHEQYRAWRTSPYRDIER